MSTPTTPTATVLTSPSATSTPQRPADRSADRQPSLARTAWAHDTFSDPSLVASFQSLPGSSFTVTGAEPARDSFAWTVLSALAGEVHSRVDAQSRVSIDLVKRRAAVVTP